MTEILSTNRISYQHYEYVFSYQLSNVYQRCLIFRYLIRSCLLSCVIFAEPFISKAKNRTKHSKETGHVIFTTIILFCEGNKWWYCPMGLVFCFLYQDCVCQISRNQLQSLTCQFTFPPLIGNYEVTTKIFRIV